MNGIQKRLAVWAMVLYRLIKNGSIIFLNKIAEDITGWKNEDVKK
jgi:PAS domain-containing protein